MTLFDKAIIEFDTDKTQFADESLGRVAHTRVMVVQCSPDTYGMIICELVSGNRSANPPNVLLCGPISEEMKFDFNETGKMTTCVGYEGISRFIKFDDEIIYWSFVAAIAGAKNALAARRVDLDDLLETVVSTIPMVEPHVPPQYAQ